MIDFILGFFRKLIEVVLILVIAIGLFNFFRTPGGLTAKLQGSYERTSIQSSRLVHAGKDLFSSQSDRVVQDIGGGIMDRKQRTEKMQLGQG